MGKLRFRCLNLRKTGGMKMEGKLDTIGKRIKSLRKENSMTQKDVANNTIIKRGNMSHYENDKVTPGAEAIVALAKFFDVTTDWLLTGEEPAIEKGGENVYELSEDEADFIEKVRQIPKTELKQVRGMLDLKIYEMNQDKKGRSSAYQSGEEAATREKNLA